MDTFKAALDETKRKYKAAKVDVVAHSMGGLIVREYIQNSSYSGDIRKFMMLGTPNNGAVDAYYVWEGGVILGASFDWDEVFIDIAIQYMKLGCGGGITNFSFIRNRIPSLKELLPTFPFLLLPGFSTVPQPLVCEINTVLRDLNAGISDLTSKAVDIRIFAGTGQDTPGDLTIQNIAVPCAADTKWTDGQPGVQSYLDGDMTVLESRISIGGIPVVTKPAAHGQLPSSFSAEVLEFLQQ